jgi:hypothetical protein|tara:strand:- start:338 stop:478 length:141 start_codon:yes stop_codon:yes gene_type:complete
MGLTFIPIKTKEEIIIELHHTRNEISLLKLKANKLIDELIDTNKEA